MHSYTTAAKQVLDLAIRFSSSADDGYIGTEHLLLGLLYAKTENNTPCIASKLLTSRGITEANAGRQPLPNTDGDVHDAHISERISAAYPHFTPVLCRILKRAEEEAQRFQLASDETGGVVGSEHLLFSLLCETDAAAHHVIARQNLPLHELYGDVLSFLSAVTAEEAIFSGQRADTIETDVKQAEHPSYSQSDHRHADMPFLLDMTACAASGKYDAVVGREDEEEAVLRILLHRRKNNPCLLGEAGVGKTAIVEGLAARIARGAVPQILLGARIFSLDLGGMLAGAKYRGEFEERMRHVLSFCREHTPSVILFIDEIHMLMGAGAAEGTVDAANLLKPALSRGEIRVIGATTREEFDKSIGRDGAMSRRFQSVSVEEPDTARARRMISALKPRLEHHHGVCITDAALDCAISASVRCLPEFFLPDKAIDLLDDACAAVRTAASAQNISMLSSQIRRDDALLSGNYDAAYQAVDEARNEEPYAHTDTPLPTVTTDDICRAAERRTGIRITADGDDHARYLTLEAQLNHTVLGQEHAISAITEVLRRQKSNLMPDRDSPISFLFYGPAGVGKTAVCETLAAHLFDSPHAFLRFDMSEYREAHTVSRLIGAPPGYVGHSDGGILTSAVRHRPYALILFDAIELAHPDVRRLIVQILDSGILTDSRGNRVSFRHTILVLTANTAVPSSVRQLGFVSPSAQASEQALLPALLSADLLSRIDARICFRPLEDDTRAQIARKLLASYADRLSERGISLHYDDSLIAFLLCHAPKDRGARGLCRTVEQMIEPPIAHALLSGTLSHGDRVRLIAAEDAVILEQTEHADPQRDSSAE